MNNPAIPAPALAPGRGVDAVRDAVAAVKCCAANDTEGLHAILMGTDDPRAVLGMLAAMTTGVLASAGLDAGVLDEIAGCVIDGLLDEMPVHGTEKV